jgi:hypothetical protein
MVMILPLVSFELTPGFILAVVGINADRDSHGKAMEIPSREESRP